MKRSAWATAVAVAALWLTAAQAAAPHASR